MKSKIAIFASGRGSNSRAIIHYFKDHPFISVDCIICNRKNAGVFDVAEEEGVAAFHFGKEEFQSADKILELLKIRGVDWIVLAGFLLKVPSLIIGAYQGRMVNIHPSLLPKFGGAGMYGDNVHLAVLEAGEPKSGISIHWVDEGYDTGSLIQQFECIIEENDDLQSLKSKIQKLEHEHLPQLLESLIQNEKG
ncbi:MAG: phosphoribosylglycinamide formyltransferase [Flavobacteriales bacterium]|nr:phosphoribosylglycinamide formyltransferase [Flavobacteriales bacterium]|tara:strand:+ start:1615 stop:2193 length:579 start_codon:yes stop_codon:yes gene_type:complete